MPNTSQDLDLKDIENNYVYIEQGEEVTESTRMTVASVSPPTKGFSHFRLNPTQLNNLNLSYLVSCAAENQYDINDGFVETGSLNIRTYFKHLAIGELDFFVFQAVCDKQTDKTNNLAFINDVIEKFKDEHPDLNKLNAKLLIPLNQSRLGKRHSVLVEITLGTKIEEITLHNSQSKWSSFAYPNCLNDLRAERINNSYYQMQKDDISCGFLFIFILNLF